MTSQPSCCPGFRASFSVSALNTNETTNAAADAASITRYVQVALCLQPCGLRLVFSDGTETPQGMVSLALRNGLDGIAITDHDTSAGWDDAADAAAREGIALLRGTEITAVCGSVSVHMLGLQYDPANKRIADMFSTTRRKRLLRTRHMVERMAQDFPITWQKVEQQVKEGSRTTVGRPHIADALVAAGVYRTRSEAFAGAVSAQSKYYIPTPSPTAREVVETVKQAGGVIIIAHPGDRRRNDTLLSDVQIGMLVDAGLDGLEVWHRGNLPDQRRRLLDLARKYGLLVTGGSDWHGAGKPNALGENLTDAATVERIVERGVLALV